MKSNSPSRQTKKPRHAIAGWEALGKANAKKERIANNLLTGEAPLLTNKYLVFPTNEHYNSPTPNQTNVIFLDLSGKLVKKVRLSMVYTDVFSYKENGVLYQQSHRL